MLENKRICVFPGVHPLPSRTFISSQAKALTELGAEVDILTLRKNNNSFKDRDYKIISAKAPENKLARVIKAFVLLFLYFWKYPRIIKSLNPKYGKDAISLQLFYVTLWLCRRKESYDVVHCHFGRNCITGGNLRDIGFEFRLIGMFHGSGVRGIEKEGKKGYSNFIDFYDCILTNSIYNKNKLVEAGFPERDIGIHRLGINLEDYSCSKTFNNVILTVARLEEEKGVEHSLEVISRINNRLNTSIKYIVVGDGSEREYLEKKASELSISDVVEFKGFKKHEEVIKWYKKSSVFLLNSKEEGLGRVLLEAQASCIPVVCSDSGGISEALPNKDFITKYNNYEDMTDNLEKLLTSEELAMSRGIEGRKFVEDNFSYQSHKKKLVEIYESI